MHRTAASSLVIGVLLMTAAVGAHALGFGRADGQHLLGQPLTFRIPLNLDGDESIGAECASAEVLAGDQRLPNDTVRASIEPGSESGSRVLRITTRASIDEPIVTVTAAVGCPTRLSRRFVLFLDPPTVQLAAAPEPAAAPAPAPRGASARETATAGTPLPELAAGSDTPPPRPRRAARPAASAPAPRASAPVAATRGPRERLRAAAPAASAAAPRARLQLEPLEPAVRSNAVVAAASAPPPGVVADAAAQAASAASAAADANARVRALEESLARLKNESKAAQDSMAEMRARLRAAEGANSDRWLLYGLGGLVLMLVVLLALLLRQRSRERQAMWWAAGQAAGAQEPEPSTPPARASVKPAVRMPPVDAESRLAPTTTPAALQPTQPVPMPDAEPRREVTVEELIDLEQQAEFFLVLGQDDAAIDLLMGHLRSTGGSSPLPYLKLLEIYRRRNEREAYERIRERFNQRFNAHAPAWETDFAHGRSLEDYPEVLGRVQSLWRMPSLAMRELESLLFRQDQQAASFDLPAYREVLFLYSMARDLAQEEALGGGVDLLLPIDDVEAETANPVPLHPDVSPGELHLDLDLGPVEEDEITQGKRPIGSS